MALQHFLPNLHQQQQQTGTDATRTPHLTKCVVFMVVDVSTNDDGFSSKSDDPIP